MNCNLIEQFTSGSLHSSGEVMALFDAQAKEVANSFDLGEKAVPLLAALLTLIAAEERGGLAGFLARFRAAGMGELADSWIDTGANKPLTESQLEQALGRADIEELAVKAGLGVENAKPALAFLIPTLIDKLSPSGKLPASLPSSSSLLTGATGRGGEVSANAALTKTVATTSSGIKRGKFLLLILLVLVLVLGYQYCDHLN